MELPEKFVERVLRDLGAGEGAALCAALDGVPEVSVRLNEAKCDGAGMPDVVAQGAAERVPWSPQGFYLAERPQFTFDSDFHAGAYYVQEASSQFVGHLLRDVPTRGARILDLCAAPGGKTTLYASLAGPEGLVVANEIDRKRAQVLADNVRKWGTGNVAVTCCEPGRMADFAGWFDVVAVDAPCSGEGMFRKDAGARAAWSEGNVRLCAARQEEILRAAWRLLKPGGTLIYSTCTFNREGERRVARTAVGRGGRRDGRMRSDRRGRGVGHRLRSGRSVPHVPVLPSQGPRRGVLRLGGPQGGGCGVPRTPAPRPATAHRGGRSDDGGRAAALGARTRADALRRRGRYLLRMVRGAGGCRRGALRSALPVICSGVALGQLFKGRLKPDPALAFFAGLDRAATAVAELDEEQALRYLRRQEVAPAAFAEGMNLVAARGRALGFAKRIGGRVNNLYPQSLRILKGE